MTGYPDRVVKGPRFKQIFAVNSKRFMRNGGQEGKSRAYSLRRTTYKKSVEVRILTRRPFPG